MANGCGAAAEPDVLDTKRGRRSEDRADVERLPDTVQQQAESWRRCGAASRG
jgi:hypothetical protein